MNKKVNLNSTLISILEERPILFNPTLARIGGSVTCGVFLSQLLYWDKTVERGKWFYKTINELEEETCLSRRQQDLAIRKWVELDVIKYKVSGVPPKRYFRINTDCLIGRINTYYDRNIAVKRGENIFVPKYE